MKTKRLGQIFFGGALLASLGSVPASAETLPDRIADEARQRLILLDEPLQETGDTILLAKKKKNNKNKRRPPTSKKTVAKIVNRRHMDEEAEDRLNALGESNDTDPAVVSQRGKLKVDRLVAAHGREKRFVDAIKTRVFQGGDINQTDSSGKTYLHIAVLNGYEEAVDFLLSEGAKKDVKDAAGNTPKKLAERMKQYKIAAKFH